MKSMRFLKMLSGFLAATLIANCASATVFAAESSMNISDSVVCWDKYSTESFEMAMFNLDNRIYVVTMQNDGKVEVASSELDGEGLVNSLWFTLEDVGWTNEEIPTLDDMNFVNSVINFGEKNMEESSTVVVEQTTVSNKVAMREETDEYDYLMSQLEDIYGPPYLSNDWTGVSPEIIDGLTVSYNEWLNYDMTYQDGFEFSAGTSLGSFVTGVASILKKSVPLSIIATVLGVPSMAATILDHAGLLAHYTGSVEYNRYVNINNGGPYFDCFKWIEYRGWVEEGNYYSGVLEEISTKYSYTELVFEDYERQRDLALSNYGAK